MIAWRKARWWGVAILVLIGSALLKTQPYTRAGTRWRIVHQLRSVVAHGPLQTSITPLYVVTIDLRAEATTDGALLVTCRLDDITFDRYVPHHEAHALPDGIHFVWVRITFIDRDWDGVPDAFGQPDSSTVMRPLPDAANPDVLAVWDEALYGLEAPGKR